MGGELTMATVEMMVGNVRVVMHDKTGFILLSPEEQQKEFDRRLAAGDPVAVGIARAVADIYHERKMLQEGR